MGQFMQVKVRSVSGDVAAVVNTPEFVYVIEFNLRDAAEEALQQMDDDDYPIPYLSRKGDPLQ